MDMARLLASVTLSPVGNEQLERGVLGESQCRVASSIFFLAERRNFFLSECCIEIDFQGRSCIFFLPWLVGGGGVWLGRSTSSVADTLQGKTKLTKQKLRPYIRQSQQFRYLTQQWSGCDDVL